MMKMAVILGVILANNAANANMTEWEKYCRSEAFIVEQIQMLRTTVYLDQAQATKEVVHLLMAGEYKKYDVIYDPEGVPYVADSVFYQFDKNTHHLEASRRYFESCMAAESGEGDECDGC